MRAIVIEDHFAAWRSASLGALGEGLAPELIEWRIAENPDLPQGQTPILYAPLSDHEPASAPKPEAKPEPEPEPEPTVRVSKEFAALLKDAASFRDPQRWAFLYKVLWRWQQGDRATASPADQDGERLYRMAKSVRRAQHDMIAYVRFRKRQAANETPEYVAWYEPDHDVLSWAAEHFAQRMGRSTWLITTPRGAAFWDGAQLHLDARVALAGEHRCETADEAEALWLAYYRSTFNPSRLNEEALEQHMPVRGFDRGREPTHAGEQRQHLLRVMMGVVRLTADFHHHVKHVFTPLAPP